MAEEFWLSDGQWARLAPLLPNKPRGVPRVDDRRVISGIIHVLKSGGRWADAPSSYGPRKTLYDRFVRWAAKGVWSDLFEMLATAVGRRPTSCSTARRSRRTAVRAAVKGGAEPGHRPLARRADDEDPRPDRRRRPAAGLSADRRSGGGLPSSRTIARAGAARRRRACRQRL